MTATGRHGRNERPKERNVLGREEREGRGSRGLLGVAQARYEVWRMAMR